jgi:hypothetical protein
MLQDVAEGAIGSGCSGRKQKQYVDAAATQMLRHSAIQADGEKPNSYANVTDEKPKSKNHAL